MLRLLVLVVALSCVCAHKDHNHKHGNSGSTEPSSSNNPVTITPSGRIRGSWLQTRRGRRVQAYRGIRYGAPPTGELRFQPPKPILQYPSEVDATAEGPACPQPVIDPDYYVDEDCLRLNVYAPEKKPTKPLPVLVYIHSGGFYSASGRSDIAGPDYLLDRDLILVTINYRLASLGFISTGDKHAPGNNGFKDQVMALKWIQRNIAAFGGDPNLVTISGCSAGGFSVMLHMVSPMSKGLFHRGVSISGSPISQVAIRPHQKELAVKQAQLLGCPTDSSEAIISCLKTKPWRDIGNSLDNMFTFGYDPVLLWAPIVEPDVGQERFLTENPLDSVRQGRMHPVPYIIGQTTREFFWKAFSILENENYTDTMNSEWERIAPVSFLLPPEKSKESANRLKQAYLGGKPLRNDSQTADGLGKLYGDSLIGFGAHRLANLMSRRSPHKVFYYEFAYVGNHSHYEDPVTGKPVGAAHHDDLIYLFGLTASFPIIPLGDTLDSATVDVMTGIMYNFAKNGYVSITYLLCIQF
uniref:Carboxylic ester hydrolase n=1 Tax=Cotesia flavipes TaxID=89805 RepID=A0A8K1YTS1_COTFL|nr:teratocyte carboxylic ester hydrolase [Cotesia flavipes]